jgi:hypothetical protein
VLGLLNPIIAAAVMAMSSLSVIVNSATLKRLSRDQPSGAHPPRGRATRDGMRRPFMIRGGIDAT